jgi:hypothetical protein
MVQNDWKTLLSLPKWCPLHETGLHVREVSDPLFVVGRGVYLTLNEFNFETNTNMGGPFITSVLWASSEGAAQRAINLNIEADEQTLCSVPPIELLPAPEAVNYGSILHHFTDKDVDRLFMDHSSYRGTDGLFLTRVIDAHPFEYYFRSPEPEDSEVPFAISYRLIGK